MLHKNVQSYVKNSIFAQSKAILTVIYCWFFRKNGETKAIHIQPVDPGF